MYGLPIFFSVLYGLYGAYSFINYFNDRIAEKLPLFVRNYTKKKYSTTKQTVIRLPANNLPVKIKKILNISRDFIEISEYCDKWIEYNNHIVRKINEPDSSRLLQRPIHRVPVYCRLKWTRNDAKSQLKILSINSNKNY